MKHSSSTSRYESGPFGVRIPGGWVLVISYLFDWVVLIAFGAVGIVLGDITPNKRPFSLEDPNISFPFTVKETVTARTLLLCSFLGPIVIIGVIALILVPGATVPKGIPKSLVWQRKLWECHIGILGLLLSLVGAWFITSGMKNLFGKPRPDLLSRCQPDLANLAMYVVGGLGNSTNGARLVSGDICKNPDKSTLDDGFRSYPSGHSSLSAAGLIYLTLFIASKFAITIPFLAPSGYYANAASFSAFPSRSFPLSEPGLDGSLELSDRTRNEALSLPADAPLKKRLTQHSSTVAAVRRQAAAPPLYLLAICLMPTGVAIFIASSRWFDFRHHGFDILFGFLIGITTAFYSFRFYHLPIGVGAGWAWGPRSRDKAFWSGVGSFSYATDHWRANSIIARPGDEEEGLAPPLPNRATGNATAGGTSSGRDGPNGNHAVERTNPPATGQTSSHAVDHGVEHPTPA